MNLHNSIVKNTKKIKIETPFGFENFYGVNKITKLQYIHLKFTNNKELKCSLDHPFDTINGILKAKDLNEKVEIYTKDGGCFITKSEIINEPIELYDIVNSGQKHLYYSNNIVSHNCSFLGSSNTLISPAVLQNTPLRDYEVSSDGLDVITPVEKDHTYVMTVDVAEGVGQNNSAFVIIDITDNVHTVVAKYKNNEVDNFVFPDIILKAAKNYNNAYILCETNFNGSQIGKTLQFELEYPNLLMSISHGRTGFVLGQHYSERNAEYGVKMSKKTKREGCSTLKTVMEKRKLYVYDADIIQELSTYVQKRDSFAAEDGCFDDLVSCLVLYGWMVTQEYFKDLTDQNIRQRISEETKEQLEERLAPFGFIDDGQDENQEFVDDDGTRWYADNFDVSHEWLIQ